jgi:hypothetical protein
MAELRTRREGQDLGALLLIDWTEVLSAIWYVYSGCSFGGFRLRFLNYYLNQPIRVELNAVQKLRGFCNTRRTMLLPKPNAQRLRLCLLLGTWSSGPQIWRIF